MSEQKLLLTRTLAPSCLSDLCNCWLPTPLIWTIMVLQSEQLHVVRSGRYHRWSESFSLFSPSTVKLFKCKLYYYYRNRRSNMHQSNRPGKTRKVKQLLFKALWIKTYLESGLFFCLNLKIKAVISPNRYCLSLQDEYVVPQQQVCKCSSCDFWGVKTLPTRAAYSQNADPDSERSLQLGSGGPSDPNEKENACGPASVSVNINCAPCLPAVGVMLLNNSHLFVAALLDWHCVPTCAGCHRQQDVNVADQSRGVAC